MFEGTICIIDMRIVQYGPIGKVIAKYIVEWMVQGFSEKIIARCIIRLVMQSPRVRAKAKCSINLSKNSIENTTEGLRGTAANLR